MGPYVKDVVVLVMMMVIVGFQRGDMKQRLSHGDLVHVMRCYMFMFMVIVCVCVCVWIHLPWRLCLDGGSLSVFTMKDYTWFILILKIFQRNPWPK